MKTYQIKDWDSHFENDRSRQRSNCSFVCVPNKQHGMGFCRIMAEPDGAAIYGIWHCIVGACSQQRRRNGWLTCDGDKAGSAWGVSDLALKFRRPEKEVERALQVLCCERVGWITAHDNSLVTADSPPTHLEEKGREGKEEKGREGSLAHYSEPEIPSWEEFWEYCKSPNCGISSEWFAKDKFQAQDIKGWEQIKEWRKFALRVRGWWDNDGRPASSPSRGNGQAKRLETVHYYADATFDCRTPEEISEQEMASHK